MKQIIITLTLLLALGMTTEAVAQKHRHTPQTVQLTELVDSTGKDAVEAFSDTTSTSQTSATDDNWPLDDEDDTQVVKSADRLFDFVDSQMSGMLFVLAVLLIIFVLSPVFIIIAVFYFINKNRKDKMRLAQMAMQQGQPIPDQLLKDQPGSADEEYNKGIRQCFVGVGLMIFLGYAAGTVGFGVGALVFCIGLGKVFVSKTARKDNKNDITQL
jgi:hypothetical protein